MSVKRQRRDWKAVYLEYCESGLSVEQFGRTIGVSGSWITENFRRLSRAGEVVYPLPKESPAQEPSFMPLIMNDATAANPAEADDHHQILKITIGKAVMEIPSGISEDTLKSVIRIACEVC